MKCSFIVRNNGNGLKWKRWKQKESQLADYSLSEVFNDINDN